MESLIRQLREIGVQRGDTLMVHASMRRVGKIERGADGLIDALLDTLGPEGTLFAYADFEPVPDVPYFDPARSPCAFAHGVFPEVFRKRPGVLRSMNPGASVLATGARAIPLTAPHPLLHGYGPDTPFERFVACGGKVLLLGSSLDAVSLIHHAEAIADLPGKHIVRARVDVLVDGALRTVDIEEFDTSGPVVSGMPDNSIELIVKAFIAHEQLTPRLVGGAESYLLDAQRLVRFAKERMEHVYGSRDEAS